MPTDRPAAAPDPRKPETPSVGETCPRCGKVLDADYRCGCPDRWENEGGAPAPGR
jgi:hypothetical protein